MPRFRNPVVSTANILDGSITTAKLADGAVATAKLANLAVAAAKLANSSVTATKIANLAVGTAAIANAAITSAKIANLAVGTAQIANAAITSAKIANLAVGTAQIANAAITSAKIDDLTALRYRTSASGRRLEIRGDTGESFVSLYNSSGTRVGEIGIDATGFGLNEVVVSGPDNVILNAGAGIELTATGSAGYGIIVTNPAPAGGIPGKPFAVIDGTGAGFRVQNESTPTNPTWAFHSDPDTGVHWIAGNRFGLGVGGVRIVELSGIDFQAQFRDGSETRPVITNSGRTQGLWFNGNFDTRISVSQATQFRVTVGNVYLTGARNNTTASAANTLIQAADGRIFRSTSSKRYKTAVRPWDRRHSVLDLAPVLYRSTSKGDDSRRVRLGVLAEEVAEAFPLAAVYHDGRPDGVDWNTLIAGLIAELAELEGRVAALEAA